MLAVIVLIAVVAPTNIARSASSDAVFGDVWYRTLSKVPLSDRLFFFYDPNSNDYLIAFQKSRSDVENPKTLLERYIYEAVRFFTGRVTVPVDLRQLHNQFQFLRIQRSLQWPDGYTVEIKNLDSRPSGQCPQELNNYLQLRGSRGEIVQNMMVLYLLPEPAIVDVRSVPLLFAGRGSDLLHLLQW